MKQNEIVKTISSMVHECVEILSDEIPFRQHVVEACRKNYCGRYGKTWQCPPGVGTLEELQKKCLVYRKAIVFTTRHDLEDSFDLDGMTAGRKRHEEITDKATGLFAPEDIRVLSAEGCGLCETCTYPHAPCRFPERARSSVEANGISVVELAQKCGLHYTNGENTVTYFSMILYDKN